MGTLCQRLVVTIERSDEVIHAAQLMRDKHIGYLVVVEPHAAEGCLRAVHYQTDQSTENVVAYDWVHTDGAMAQNYRYLRT